MAIELLLIGLEIMEMKRPDKFQLMLLSPKSADGIELKYEENATLKSEKAHGALDNQYTFSDHIVPAASKLPGNLTLWPEFRNTVIRNPKSITFYSRITSKFEYYPLKLEWHSCWKTTNNKLEKIQSGLCEFIMIHVGYHIKRYM